MPLSDKGWLLLQAIPKDSLLVGYARSGSYPNAGYSPILEYCRISCKCSFCDTEIQRHESMYVTDGYELNYDLGQILYIHRSCLNKFIDSPEFQAHVKMLC